MDVGVALVLGAASEPIMAIRASVQKVRYVVNSTKRTLMSNTNYVRGRNFEYQLKRELEADNWTVFRTAGSHGAFDIIALRELDQNEPEVRLIQCKVTKNKKSIKQLLKEFTESVPFSRVNFTQELAVKITGSREYKLYRPGDKPDE